MRTTINIDDKLFEIVRSTAHQNRKGIGATVQALIERGLSQQGDSLDKRQARWMKSPAFR